MTSARAQPSAAGPEFEQGCHWDFFYFRVLARRSLNPYCSPGTRYGRLISLGPGDGTPPIVPQGTGFAEVSAVEGGRFRRLEALAMVAVSTYLRRDPKDQPFMFATGLECSYPVITGKDGRDFRVDELRETGHYQHWREDFELVRELGLQFLRYGVPYYKVHLGPGRYDWSFADEVLRRLKEMGITPILDLCHFGVPDWVGSFQNPDWPAFFAEYARAVAERYPWVTLFTPVNEIYVACWFSAKNGWWNERLKGDVPFVRALKHCVQATLRAEAAILRVRPEAVFIQSESTSYFHAEEPAALERTHFMNQQRFLSLDLCYGVDVSSVMFRYLTEHGMTTEDYEWFMVEGRRYTPSCVMGNDYYATNEYMVPLKGDVYGAGRVYGYYMLTQQYYRRYELPVMHTETNQLGMQEAVLWLRNQWLNMVKLKEDGVPIVGFTWFSLLDQVDWDTGLREHNGHVDTLGLFGLDRKIHPVGTAYKDLVNKWREILPMESRQLDMRDVKGVRERKGKF